MIGSRCLLSLFFLLGAWIVFLPCSCFALDLPAGPHGPDSLFAVDKNRQTMFYFRKNIESNNLDLVREIPCTTGKVLGDKIREGDMKTPEGIYFVQGKKDNGLDFGLYGNLAFVLNFPNPVDKANGKTGHGIWIHGRGKPITPRETNGCVALNNHDIMALQPDVRIKSTPVVISDTLAWSEEFVGNEETSQQLIALTRLWAQSWDKKSPRFFSFYDTEYFSQKFTDHKKRLFIKYKWIDVVIDDIKCIAGEEYSVTYFNQLYIAPGFRSEGVKRLYWKKSSLGEWKIIGSEWFHFSTGLDELYTKALTSDLKTWLENWRTAWQEGNIDRYIEYYAAHAVQGNLQGAEAIGAYKRELVREGKKPTRIVLGSPVVTMGTTSTRITFVQEYSSENGYTDKGIKELVVQRTDEDDWQIVSETWKRLGS
ncbi:L,D-transpeptidase Cds6 family protein [Desulfoplanes sp. PS50]